MLLEGRASSFDLLPGPENQSNSQEGEGEEKESEDRDTDLKVINCRKVHKFNLVLKKGKHH